MLPRSFRSNPITAVVAMLGLLTLATIPVTASAQIVRIEEDWEVQIGTPDPEGHAPQIITALSSTDKLEDVHAVFELNHATLPDYQAGGMELQVWSSDLNLNYRESPKTGTLHVQNEVIKYTMSMKISGCSIEFEVKDGSSTTWGNFGSQGYLKVAVPTCQTSLWKYSSATSVANSKVGFAKHRVKKFFLKEVRYYNTNGLVATDTTDRVVHELESGE